MRVLNKLGRKALMLAGTSALALAATAALPAAAAPTYAYQTTIQIPGTLPFSGYDLSTFDATTQLYYLTDRTNRGVDVFSAATNSYVERIAGGFAGTQGGNNGIAGPNGISLSNLGDGSKFLLAGDGASTVVAFRLDSSGLNLIGGARTSTTISPSVPTPTPPNRVDGVAYAPNANTIIAANNASNPGFITLQNAATGAITHTILLNGTGGTPNVGGNGVEATIFNTVRGTFFVAVPTLSVDASDNAADAGGLIEVDPASGTILNTYNFNALGITGACSPTGLVQGGGVSMFVACSDTGTGKSVILNPTGTGTATPVNGISGGDQAAYDPRRNVFFEAARFQAGGPVLGIVDAATLALQTIAIGNNDHAVSVDPISGEVFIATGPTTAFANCSNGCIGVLGVAATAVPEPASLPLIAAALAGLGLVAYRRRA